MVSLDTLLPLVRKPSRYCGNEFNVIRKDWQGARLRLVFAFPDMYEIGMSHQGLQILYHIVNGQQEYLAERVYVPDCDLEQLLRQKNEPLFSLESRRPLTDFDVLGITLPYELCYTNILTILDLAGIPFRAVERDDRYPLVIGGGPCAFHPEPVADFFDAILLGDGEEAVLEMADIIKEAKQERTGKAELLNRLRRLPGVYVPSLFQPRYGRNGDFAGMRPLEAGYEMVGRRILPDLDGVSNPTPPLVPVSKIVHDRMGVEIARGCTRGCRFCQAGIICRPVRERTPARIMELAREGIELGGFEELALLSLSTGDYSCLSDLLVQLMDTFSRQKVSVSMPSMRVGTLKPEIMAQIKRVRKTGFTLAPEAGTDRLRRVLNKGITEEDLLDTCRSAFGLGWKLIKLYFMFGLPTETPEDLEEIPHLARKALSAAGKGGCKINVSAATFVPKPHTPFQWEPQLSIDEGFARVGFLKDRLRNRAFKLKWHDPRQSFLEGVMSRGDRRLSRVIEEAWRNGARFDAWSDHYNLDVWRRAAETCGLELERYLRRRDPDEPLPWQHLDAGVGKDFFKTERAKAFKEEYTPDCRVHGCQKCGLCDFKTVQPIVHRSDSAVEQAGLDAALAGEKQQADGDRKPKTGNQAKHFVYRVDYSKRDTARFIGHLELIQVFFRSFRRVRLPLNFSEGFNPSPKVSFGPALPVGTESMAEYLLVDLKEPLADAEAVLEKLNRQLPAGITVTGIGPSAKSQGSKIASVYRITLPQRYPAAELEAFLRKDRYPVTLLRKGRTREIEARALVKGLEMEDNGTITLTLLSETGMAGVKPLELLAVIMNLSDEETRTAGVMKLWSRERE